MFRWNCGLHTQYKTSQRSWAGWMLSAALFVGTALPRPSECAEAQTFESYAILRVRQDTDTNMSLAGWRVLIKSPFVLQSVLAMPGVADLPWIASRKDAKREMDWLSQQIIVHGINGADGKPELLLIGMKGDDRRQIAVLVNAVAKTFVDRVAGEERKQIASRKEELEKKHQEKLEDVKRRREFVEKAAKTVGTDDIKVVQAKQENLVDYLLALAKETRVKRAAVQQKEKDLAQNKGDNAEREKQTAELATFKAEQETLQTELKTVKQQMEDLLAGKRDLVRRKEDLAMAEAMAGKLRAAIDQYEAELRKPDRITLLQEAPLPSAAK